MSVDLTAFNGVEDREEELPSAVSTLDRNKDYTQVDDRATPSLQWHQSKRVFPFERSGPPSTYSPLWKQKFHLKSLERGYHSTVTTAAGTFQRVKRNLWEQEPGNLKKLVAPGFSPPLPPGQNPTGGDLINVPHTDQRRDQLVKANEPPAQVLKMLPPPGTEHVVDYVLDQTLGFQN
jgi:hypothetical protein